MASESEVADLIEQAANLIETYGWIQGQYGDETMGYCVMGALERAASAGALDRKEAVRAGLALGRQVGAAAITIYNDAPERTKNEVIDLMKHTAKDLHNRAVPA